MALLDFLQRPAGMLRSEYEKLMQSQPVKQASSLMGRIEQKASGVLGAVGQDISKAEQGIESFRQTARPKLESFFERPQQEVAKDIYGGIGKGAKELSVGTARLPFTIPTKVLTTLTGQKQYTPESKVEKFLVGNEPITSYTEDQKKVQEKASQLGLSKNLSVVAGAVAGAGEVGLDLFPAAARFERK